MHEHDCGTHQREQGARGISSVTDRLHLHLHGGSNTAWSRDGDPSAAHHSSGQKNK